MKIEDGKKYIDGENTIVGPIQRRKDEIGYYPFYGETNDGNYRVYTADGCYLSKDNPSVEDLVAEYKESPVFVKPIAYFSSEEKIPTDDDCMAYTEQNNDDSSLPLLNIFKPIRTKNTHRPAKFLARADDGSYLFQIGDDWDEVLRYRPDEVDDSLENVPKPEPTKALIYLCQNIVTGEKYIRSIKPVEDKLLSSCELTYSDEENWQVRDLKGEKCNG